MFGKILAVILVVGLIAFSSYQVYLFVKQLKNRKKAKSDKGDVDSNK